MQICGAMFKIMFKRNEEIILAAVIFMEVAKVITSCGGIHYMEDRDFRN